MTRVYANWPMNVCQYGAEGTDGVAQDATGIWRGPFGGFEDDNKVEEFDEDVGSYAVTRQEFVTWLGVKVSFPAAPMNFAQLPIILKASVIEASPSGSGPYVRDYVAAVADTDPELQPFTLRVGNKRTAADVQVLPYSFVREWELSGKQGELWKLSGTWTSPRRTSGAFTPDVPLRTFDPAIFAKTLLYIDNAGGTIGTTQKTGVLLAASIKYTNGLEWLPVGDGNLYATNKKLGKPKITFSLTFELEQDGSNSIVATERARYDSRSFGLFRLRAPGSGTNTIDIDWAGKYNKVGAYSKEGDADTAVTFEGEALYSSTDAKFFGIKHTSSLVSIQ